jgi:membrane fusion protein, multidrug efflux system
VTLRAEFPNPDGLLLPGMYVRARIAQAVDKGVFLVPQPAVQRDPRGGPEVWIATAQDKAELRTVTVTRTHGSDWVVTSGIGPRDRIIIQGTGNLRPGQDLKPVPAAAPQPVGPPGKPDGGSARPGAGR